MDQIEVLKQTLIAKNNEIAELKKLVRVGVGATAEKSTLEKSMWAMLFVLCEKFVKCEKCGNVTKPATNKNNYMLARCNTCDHYMNIKRGKGAAMNAYFSDFRRATRGY